jgi:ligand-binding sensor domain-containing protein
MGWGGAFSASACAAAWLAMLSACADTEADATQIQAAVVGAVPAAQGSPPKVLDSFVVGAEVYVRSFAVDRAANSLWVGTSTGVLEIGLDGHELRNTFTREHGLANEYVFAIHVDAAGYKWFGTNAGGVSRYRDGDWRVLFPMHGLADYWVYSFAQQAKGPLWIGTWAGANRVDPESLRFETFVEELVNEWVYGIGVDARDRVWFGTEGGVSMFDGDRWQHWTHADGLGAPNRQQRPASPNTGLGTRSRHDVSVLLQGVETYNPNYVFALIVAPDERIWVGTWGGGAASFDGRQWRNYTTEDGLAGNIVYSIAASPDGVLWFGTNHGLSRYDGERWVNYGHRDGLLDDNVYALAIDPGGDIWVGTKRGVTRLGH